VNFINFFLSPRHHVQKCDHSSMLLWMLDNIDEASFQALMRSAKETGKIIGGLRVSVERRRDDK